MRTDKALAVALFSVALAACGSSEGARPRQVEPSALQSEVSDPQVRAFYQARQWQAAWDRKSERQLMDALGLAAIHGLRRDLFIKGELPKDANAREAALTGIALRYASALARGYADPTKLAQVYTLPRPNPNLAAGLAKAVGDGAVGEWLGSLAPQTDEYKALSNAHVRFLQLAAKGKPPSIPAGQKIRPGHHDPRVPLIAAALVAEGYYAPPQTRQQTQPATPSTRYTPHLVQAVRRLQADFGMKPDGIIGEETLGLLQAGPGGLARQLAVALERLRWLERTPPDTRIDVNTAAAFLDYWRGGSHVDRRNVVPGEPDKQTPQLQAPMFQLVANPKWRVPDSIAEKEMATKGSGWLAANNFAMENGRYVQQSGPKNSLGMVKFDMQDKEQIYLHDTPAKALFTQPERHRSHGCVRVHNALDFAAMLAAQNDVLDEFSKAMATREENYVKLKTQIPVRLLYHTAFLDGGRVQFRPDVYGWDDDVARALGLERAAPRRALDRQGEDVGP
jgi:murein L,D-transpeptidase YcbB/YkuD